MRRLPALVVLLVVLAAAPAARAQAPIPLGSGTQPDVVLDGAGTAYVSWIGTGPDPTPLFFCRLPRGASACDVNQQLTVPGTSLSRPYVQVDGATVHVLSYRYGLTGARFDAVYMLTSTDGGATFDGGVQVGTDSFYDAIRGPGGSVALIADNSSIFQQVPLDGAAPATTAATLSADHPYTPSLALIDPTSLLAVFASGQSAAQLRTYAAGDPNDQASWTPAVDFAAYAAYLRLTTGPQGTFLLSDNADGLQEVRRYTGGGFAPPVLLPGPAKERTGGTHDITEDPAGRLHVVWPILDAEGQHVGHAVSDDGVTWRAGQFDVGPPADLAQSASGMRVAVNADHLGVLAYDTGGGDGALVRAVRIGPDAPASTPEPQLGKAVTVQTVKGTVLVELPGTKGFVNLTRLAAIPVGSTVDTRKGTVALGAARDAAGGVQTAQFDSGLFVVKQRAAAHPVTDLVLSGGAFGGCAARGRATAARKAKVVRRLWGDGKGAFRTKGRYGAATVRGTKWLVEDRCDGTNVRVKRGTVSVRDLRRGTTVSVKAPRSYLVRR